jgi:hypothetical protein
MFENIFKRKSKELIFWDWFSANSADYFQFEKNQNVLFSKLKKQLEKINTNLTFEFSTIHENGTREFIISADGIKDAIPFVIDLVNNAPVLGDWNIIAFRQPQKDFNQINFDSLVVKAEDVFFKFAKEYGKIALELHIRGFIESKIWAGAIYILLDNVIGEYSTMVNISSIEAKALQVENTEELLPIILLPEIIIAYKSEFNN